ncbi:Rv3654c family TadE-like protein [Georgenia sp. Z1491]|uniref:Rv3654c family TadE-like protein n=1 Tax=Georgenia sp. Z1491 TaxID=3416707 RepID=UPI003CEDADE5
MSAPGSGPPAGRVRGREAARVVDRDREHGAATVLVAGVVASMLLLLVGVLALARVQVARQEAQGAADLGSLAAAGALQHGAAPAEACARSTGVVGLNEAATVSCEVEGEEVVVSATVLVELGVFGTYDAVAHARAGPVR